MNGSECKQCGMLVEPANAYHPYAACLMFKACRDGNVVQANLDAVVTHAKQPDEPVADDEAAYQAHAKSPLTLREWAEGGLPLRLAFMAGIKRGRATPQTAVPTTRKELVGASILKPAARAAIELEHSLNTGGEDDGKHEPWVMITVKEGQALLAERGELLDLLMDIIITNSVGARVPNTLWIARAVAATDFTVDPAKHQGGPHVDPDQTSR